MEKSSVRIFFLAHKMSDFPAWMPYDERVWYGPVITPARVWGMRPEQGGRYGMHGSSLIGKIAAAASLALLAGCLIIPSRQSASPGGYDREKELAYDRADVINALDGVLVKQGFKVEWKDPCRGMLSARKTGLLASDYGYNRFQKFCLFWGYASYGTMTIDARADDEGPRKTRLKLKATPQSFRTIDTSIEELELKLFLNDGRR